MANKTLNPDIAYQPKTQGFSFSTLPESRKKYKQKMSIIFALFLGLPIIFIFFCLFFIVLNYFNVINLSTVSPIFKSFPKSLSKIPETKDIPYKIPGTNVLIADGNIIGFDSDFIKVRFQNQDMKFYFTSKTYFGLSETTIVNIKSATPSSEIRETIIPSFASDLLIEKNIGKKINIQFIIVNNKNVAESIVIYK